MKTLNGTGILTEVTPKQVADLEQMLSKLGPNGWVIPQGLVELKAAVVANTEVRSGQAH